MFLLLLFVETIQHQSVIYHNTSGAVIECIWTHFAPAFIQQCNKRRLGHWIDDDSVSALSTDMLLEQISHYAKMCGQILVFHTDI